MKIPFVATQLFAGPSELGFLTAEAMDTAVRAARDLAGIDALIVWPCADMTLLDGLLAVARACGMRAYLWYPVLADPPGRRVAESALVQRWDGGRGHGRSGAWAGLRGGQEDFLFACPSNEAYGEESLSAFDALLDRTQPDGVMLDRIRFPSPANGLESLFSCFCPACAARFQAETGGSLAVIRDSVRDLFSALPGLDAQGLARMARRGAFPWITDGSAGMPGFRARSVLRAARPFSEHARHRGLSVGLDLFSPSIAGMVGQDYRELAGICDWIKPMTYCRAVGPAGLPLEISSLHAAIRALCPRLDDQDVTAVLDGLPGMDLPDTSEALQEQGLPVRFIASELDAIQTLGLPPTVRINAGIEAVSNPAFHIDITPDDLEAALAQAVGRCHGIVASWNLLHIPRESLRRIGALRS